MTKIFYKTSRLRIEAKHSGHFLLATEYGTAFVTIVTVSALHCNIRVCSRTGAVTFSTWLTLLIMATRARTTVAGLID